MLEKAIFAVANMNITQSTKKERFGWYMYDWANSAFSTTVVTLFFGPYITSVAKNSADLNGNISIFGLNIFHGAYFGYLISISVLLQVFLLPYLGALADRTNKKKLILILFTYLGAFSNIAMFTIKGENFLFGGLLFIIANLSFGVGMVVYNSFLGDLAPPEKSDSISSIGWAFGYAGAGLMLLLNLLLLKNTEYFNISTEFAVRVSILSAGIWWALFALIPSFALRNPQPPEPMNEHTLSSFQKFKGTLRDIRKHPMALLFLIAYLFYNDGVQSVIALSSQFGQQEIKLSVSTLTMVILMVQFVAFFGSILFNFISQKSGTKKAIQISLIIWILCLIYIYTILKGETEFFIIAAIIALVLGGTQALSRSMYSRFIPKGAEAEYFSLYEISDRGTSWLGPLIFALSLEFTHSYRFAVLSLVILFIIGFILLLKVRESKVKM